MNEEIFRWWLDQVGEVEWSQLTEEQKALLAAWYLLALAESPYSTEPLPTECRTALAQLTAITRREVTNSNTRRFSSTMIRVPGSVARRRSVRVTPRWKG